MIQQKHIIIFFVILLLAFFIIFAVKFSDDNKKASSPKKTKKQDLATQIKELKNNQAAIKATLASFNSKIRTEPIAASGTENPISSYLADYFITETINKDNAGTKAVWNQTNQPNAYVISVYLEKEPHPKTLLVWTGLGILPFSAYRAERNILNIVFQQSQETFSSSNNYFNIRYLPLNPE